MNTERVLGNMGDRTGSIAPGEWLIVRGWESVVTRVIIHAPGDHPESPIRNDYRAVEAQTSMGSRWAGGPVAYIGSDLRVHWER